MATVNDFKIGELVYVDSFAGLVPGKIVSIHPRRDGSGHGAIEVQMTAKRGAYKKGDIEVFSARSVIKREWVVSRGGQYHIVEGRQRRSNPWGQYTHNPTTTMFYAYRDDTPRGDIDWVSHLPGEGGKDWGYTRDFKKARKLTKRQAQRFVAMMRHIGKLDRAHVRQI